MSTKSEPFSLRLPASADALVTEEARRTRRSKGAVVVALAQEALRCRRFPGIAFRGVDWQRRAWVVGTALDVWEIVRACRDFGSVERMLAETDMAERHVRLALAYADEHAEEIAALIARSELPIEQLRVRFPAFAVIEADG